MAILRVKRDPPSRLLLFSFFNMMEKEENMKILSSFVKSRSREDLSKQRGRGFQLWSIYWLFPINYPSGGVDYNLRKREKGWWIRRVGILSWFRDVDVQLMYRTGGFNHRSSCCCIVHVIFIVTHLCSLFLSRSFLFFWWRYLARCDRKVVSARSNIVFPLDLDFVLWPRKWLWCWNWAD